MFTNRRQPIVDTAALKWVTRQKLNFQDGVATSSFFFSKENSNNLNLN